MVVEFAFDDRNEMHDVRVPFERHVGRDAHRAIRRHAADVVPSEIDEHDVLGTFFLVPLQLLSQPHVLFVGPPAGPRAGYRMRLDLVPLDTHQHFWRGPDDRAIADAEEVHVRGRVHMVSDAARLSQFEARELQVQPAQTRGVPQMLQVLNSARRNNRLYVRLVTRDGGAVVKGESLAALPPSVLAVMESDRDGGSFRSLQSALLGEWEIPSDQAVTGSRTLTIPLQE